MKTIDVQDLPESVAQAIAVVVDTLREQLRAASSGSRPRQQVKARPGDVLGRLTREEIYEDAR